MDPYAKPNERKVGTNKPKIQHVPPSEEHRSKSQRQKLKQAVTDERRAIKKAVRQDLKRKLRDELEGF